MDQSFNEQRLNRRQAARLIGSTEEFLMNCARRKRNGPPYYRYSNQTVLYRRDELLEWMDRCRVENPQATP